MSEQERSGKQPIPDLAHAEVHNDWNAQLTGSVTAAVPATSGEPLADRAASVGSVTGPVNLSAAARTWLLILARQALVKVVAGIEFIEPEPPFPQLDEPKGCFVTLSKDGLLRGCIGHLWPRARLYRAVVENSGWAATRDPRFPPVQIEEIEAVRIEISVLTEPELLRFASCEELLNQLHPLEHGVVLQIGPRVATFLPQVWAQIPDKEDFLSHLSEKCGCVPSAWRDDEVAISVYHTESFREDLSGGSPGEV